MRDVPRRVHLVGIGGIGMSGIAELLLNLGHEVSGSDLRASALVERLARLGATVATGHDAAHVGDAELVVLSSAVPADNPERQWALAHGVPVVARGAMLAALTERRRTVAVVGAHGKTTTTSMLAVLLDAVGLDPTAVIGGRVSAFGSNARLGQGTLMVVEGDESDRSFLELSPEIAILTNVDDEHLDAYDGPAELEACFRTFAARAASVGAVIACVDDPVLRRVVTDLPGRVVRYGLDVSEADVSARSLALGGGGSRLDVRVRTPAGVVDEIELRLAVPGRHNAQNALAALAAAVELGVSPGEAAAGLERFTGADRRFQRHGEVGGVSVVDDYAHHPTEIAAVLATARLLAPSRLRVVFQPHRYTRTARLRDEFATVLSGADDLVLTDVYAASEAPIEGATTEALADAVRERGTAAVRVTTLDAVPALVAGDARPGDLVLTLGAGSIGSLPPRLMAALRTREGEA